MNKNKIFRIAMAALLVVLSIAGTSMAYFTDVEEETNVFTAGNVDIQLSIKDNEVNADASNGDIELKDENVYPGQEIDINAKIKNIGSEAAYVGAIITIANQNDVDLTKIITKDGGTTNGVANLPVSFANFLTGLASDTDYTVKYSTAAGGVNHVIYVIKDTALAGKTDTVTDSCTILKKVVIPTEWDNAEMAIFNGMTLNVRAFATQTVGFETSGAEAAITTAFRDAWGGYNNATSLS